MQPGDLIAGRYRLERSLGEGGMGEVWAATHTLTEQVRALKFVHEDDEASRKRTLREARAAASVRHANVVAVHDVIEGPDGSPVLVMDLLEGETLADRLERERCLSPREAVRIACGILDALEAAHALGIVHRDLKPANVFLTPKPKILDFGVAKLTAASGPARATNLLTESGAMVGTPCYMAPEQAFGDGVVDARSDLWAVGVVLYECLAGVRPADGATMGQVFKILATGAIVPLEERAPTLPKALTALVGRLLTSDREARPKSAREVRDALRAIDLDGAAAAAVPPAREAPRADATTGNAAISIARTGTRRAPIAIGVAIAVAALATVGVMRLGPKATTAGASGSSASSAPQAAEPPPLAAPPPTLADTAPPPAPIVAEPAPSTSAPSTKAAAPKPRPKPATAPSAAPSSTSKLLTEPTF